MSDLHEARDREREPQIDTGVGYFWPLLSLSQPPLRWLVANDTMNAPVSHVVAR
jgi:hypothetical protein